MVRRTGLARNTVKRALRSSEPPAYRREAAGSRLDPFKDEIHRLLKDDPKLPGVRVRELIEPLGFDGGKTIVDDYLREVRPVFLRARTHQRRCIGRARSVSGICGRPRGRCRWVTGSCAARGWWSHVLATRARAPAL